MVCPHQQYHYTRPRHGHIRASVNMCMYINSRVHIYICIYPCIYICMHIYTFIYKIHNTGAGCGVPSLAVSLYTDASHVLVTDSFGHAIRNLEHNQLMNAHVRHERGPSLLSTMKVACVYLCVRIQVAKLDLRNST